MDYGHKVRVLRAARDLSQIDLADMTGVPNYNLSLIETGKMLPSPGWDAAIKRALGWDERIDQALEFLVGERATCDEVASA